MCVCVCVCVCVSAINRQPCLNNLSSKTTVTVEVKCDFGKELVKERGSEMDGGGGAFFEKTVKVSPLRNSLFSLKLDNLVHGECSLTWLTINFKHNEKLSFIRLFFLN